jgi:hypothetical protein
MLLNSKKIAFLGVLLAINQIVIMLSVVFQTNTLFFFGVAALIICIVIIEFNLTSGITFYVASSILAFILAPNKIQIITYIGFFGSYSIMKYIIEIVTNKRNLSVIIEYLLKIMYFNIAIAIYYFIMSSVVKIPVLWWSVILAEVFFIVYDYFLTYFINVYIDKIKPKLKIMK